MKNLKLFVVGVVLSLTVAGVAGSLNLWASDPVPSTYVENVYALDANNAFFTCYDIGNECVFVCLKCGWAIYGEEGTLGRFVGKCPICKLEYPDTVDYNKAEIRW